MQVINRKRTRKRDWRNKRNFFHNTTTTHLTHNTFSYEKKKRMKNIFCIIEKVFFYNENFIISDGAQQYLSSFYWSLLLIATTLHWFKFVFCLSILSNIKSVLYQKIWYEKWKAAMSFEYQSESGKNIVLWPKCKRFDWPLKTNKKKNRWWKKWTLLIWDFFSTANGKTCAH